MAHIVPSLVAMRPDDFWSGKPTAQGYFSSKSDYNKFMKEKHLTFDESGMDADISRHAKEFEKKLDDRADKDIDEAIHEWKQGRTE